MQWTGEDKQRAKGEGWAYDGGYLRLVAQADGRFRYPSIEHLLITIHAKAKQNSSWHEHVYMSLPWTVADDTLSCELGFLIRRDEFMFGMRPIQSMEDITARANDGCLICQKALVTLTRRKLLHGQRQNHA